MAIPNQLPGVPYAAIPKAATPAYRSMLALPPRLVVIHDTSNDATAQQEARFAATRTDPSSSWTSAHFYVDGTGPLGSVPLIYKAWAAYSYANTHGWHIEMCGYNAGMTGAVPGKTIGITAGLVRQLCEVADIPMVKLSPADVANGKRGICGHRDITIGLNVGTHDDPGPAFDWPAFIAAVNGGDMALTEADKPIIVAAVHGYKDADKPSYHDAFFGDVWPNSKTAASYGPALASLSSKVDGLTKAVTALAGGGTSVDTAAILQAVNDRAAEDAQRDAAHTAEVQALHAEIAELRGKLTAAAKAEAAALES